MGKRKARRTTKPKPKSKTADQTSFDSLMERAKKATTPAEIEQLEAEIEQLLGEKPPPANQPKNGLQNGKRNKWTVGTLGEVAEILGFALQTVKQWRIGPDPMPGEPGAYPLDQIVAWKLNQVGATAASSRTAELIQEGKILDNETKRLKLRKAQGELIEFDAVVRIFTRTIAEQKSFGKEIPDRTLDALPQNMNAKTKARILNAVRKSVETMFDAMQQAAENWANEIIETDDDDSGD